MPSISREKRLLRRFETLVPIGGRPDGRYAAAWMPKFVPAVCAFIASSAAAFAASFTVTATDVAPPAVLENQRAGILRLAVGNPLVGGPAALQLSRFGLRFETATGAGLGSMVAGHLFASIEVYVDSNASGAFEPAVDQFVNALYSPDLASDGGLSIDLATSEPADVRVVSGSSRNYFVVVRVGPEASAASPNAFRLTHLGSGPGATSAVDAGSGAALTLTAAPNVTSKLVTATLNQPPTTTGIADVTAFDTAAQALIALYPVFQDAEDPSNLLAYSVTDNTNPGLFEFVGIEPATGRLLLTYLPGVSGSSQLTIKAADTLGKSVSTSFQVNVIPLVSYSDFQTVHPGADGPLEHSFSNGLANLQNYAFFLIQRENGGTLGLPRMIGTGSARIFSHLRPKQASDVFYNYQLSQDLLNWVPAVKNIDYYENTKDMGDGSVRVELLLLNPLQKAFMRVQTQLVGSPAPPPPLLPPQNGAPGALPPPPPPGTGVPILSSAVFPTQTVLGTSQTYASDVAITDMDGDGFKDVVAASQRDNEVAWYRNNHDGTFGAAQMITTTAAGVISVGAADLDNDGRVDVAVATQNDSRISWYKRNTNGTFAAAQVLAPSANFPTAVEIADLNNDGNRDVIYASWFGNHVSWCRNLGNGGFAASAVITTQTLAPYGLTVADLDGDGFRDIVTGSTTTDSVEWYKGNGNGIFGTKQPLTTGVDPLFDAPVSFSTGDLDGDGLLDVVVSDAATNKIAWFRNLGNSTFSTRQVIANQSLATYAVLVSDLNGDGKPDVLSASVGDNRVAWIRNWGAGNFGNPDANQLVVSNSTLGAYSVAAEDFNQDGMMDVASASQDDSKVAVYINRGGQTGFSATDIAPEVILDGQQRAMLRIDVANRGVAGNDNARLDSVALLFESSTGVPMTTGQVNALIESLSIYADTNDSGAFESDSDLPVAVIPHLVLNAGKLIASVRGNALAVQVAPSTTRGFFVVPRLTGNASSQNPNAFRLTHFTQGSDHSTARDAFTGALLTIEASPVDSVTSSVTAAQINSPPTTIGLPNTVVYDTPTLSSVAVRNYFDDLEDGAAGLQYDITGNTNAGLFSFVGIDANGMLTIRYRPGVAGSSSITVKATDTLGKFVASLFSVTVSLADTFSHWSGGSGGGPTPQRLLRYGFGLSPQGGDVAGLPRMKIQGKSRVVTHHKPAWATDLSYQYEISQDMISWIPAVRGIHFHEFSKDLPNAIRQSDLVLLVNWPKAYLRARAILAN